MFPILFLCLYSDQWMLTWEKPHPVDWLTLNSRAQFQMILGVALCCFSVSGELSSLLFRTTFTPTWLMTFMIHRDGSCQIYLPRFSSTLLIYSSSSSFLLCWRQRPPPVTGSSLPLDSGFYSLPFSETFLSRVDPLFCFSNLWLLCRIILDSIHSALMLITFLKTCHLLDPNTSISLLRFMVVYARSLNISAAIVS